MKDFNVLMGQVLAICIGILVGLEHSSSIGIAICYGLILLVDIRD